MTKTIHTRATQEQTNNLALWCVQQGYTPEQIVVWLKVRRYLIKGVHFQATNVANVMQGVYLAEYLVVEGKATITKKAGLKFK